MTEETLEVTKFKPAAEHIIADLETLKVLADPLRLEIIELLRKPNTVKRVAEKIGKPPTKLYYHFNLLEKHGLILTVDTRIVSGIVEKQYQAVARAYRLERNLLAPGNAEFDENLDVTLSGIFGDARADLRESFVSGTIQIEEDAPRHKQLYMNKARLRLTPERATEFYQRLRELMKEFGVTSDEEDVEIDPASLPYSMLLLLHPSSRTGADEE